MVNVGVFHESMKELETSMTRVFYCGKNTCIKFTILGISKYS